MVGGLRTVDKYGLLIYPLILSLFVYYGYQRRFQSELLGGDPIYNVYLSPSPMAVSPLESMAYSIIQPYLIYAVSISVSSYILYRLGRQTLYIVAPLLLLAGDPITLTIYSLSSIPRLSIFSRALFLIHEPVVILIDSLRRRSIVGIVTASASSLLMWGKYIDLPPPEIALTILVGVIYAYFSFGSGALISLLAIIEPSLISLLEGGEAKTPLSPALTLTLVILLLLPINPGLNGGLDEFLGNAISDDAVYLLSDDPTLISTLHRLGIYTEYGGDAMEWNWSDREEVRVRLGEAILDMYRYGYKYIVLEKPSELAYWVSPKHFKEYKYPIREDTNRYIIVLERRGLTGGEPYARPVDFTWLGGLENLYMWTWSNISVDISVKGDRIEIGSGGAYEAYIHLNVSNVDYGGVIFSVDDYVESIELYKLNESLESLWESGYIPPNTPIALNIELSEIDTLVFKVEASGSRVVKLGFYEGGEILDVVVVNGEIRLDTVDTLSIEYTYTYDVDKTGFNMGLLSLLLTPLAYFMRWEPPKGSTKIYRFDSKTFGLALYASPILLYMGHPNLLEVNWIGGGIFLLSLSIYLLIYTSPRSQTIRPYRYILPLFPIVVLTALFVKLYYGDFFDVIGDHWRNMALYTTIDASIIGSYLMASMLIVSMDRITALPSLYLLLNSFAFITDLFRIDNPLFNAILEANVILVDLSLEAVGYLVEYAYVPAGYAIYLYLDRLLTIVILGWPCAGVTGLFLFTSFSSSLRDAYRLPRPLFLKIVGFGLIGTFLLNIGRVDAILLLNVYYGVDAAELFHSTLYELIFLLWILSLWIIIHLYRSRLNL